MTCRVLKFAKQPYYLWLQGPVTQRDWDDAHLINASIDIHIDDPAFGYRFIADELAEDGFTVSERRVWRLCSQMGIFSAFVRKKRGKNRLVGPPVRDDLVRREFTAERPDLLWLTDITEHPTAWIPVVVATPTGEVSQWRRRDTPTSRRKSSSGFLIEEGPFELLREQPGFTRTPDTTGCARRG